MTRNFSFDKSFGDILRLAVPLILSASGLMVMQFIDALFLSWYSADAMAAAIPAGMASWLLVATFQGTAGYTSTFVAQYVGADRLDRAGATVWQGVYYSAAAGILTAFFALLAHPIFALVNHPAPVQAGEVTFFAITCLGAIFPILGNAVSGFFLGRDDTRTIMVVQTIGLVINGVFDWLLIFGNCGLPRLGITGAALATVLAQALVFAIFAAVFLRKKYRRTFGTWRSRAFDPALMWRLVRFGTPNGVRWSIEMLSWTMFLFFVGRIGTYELVATNIAWRINGFAFFPIIGLSQAVAILVGNAQGAKETSASARITFKGILLAEVWMITASIIFITLPVQLYSVFNNGAGMSQAFFDEMSATGVVLLRFVALYSLFDAFNIMILGTLQAAGDTRWTFVVAAVMNAVFLASLWICDSFHATLIVEWIICTAFVITTAIVWIGRFRSGRWKTVEVIENFQGAVPPA